MASGFSRTVVAALICVGPNAVFAQSVEPRVEVGVGAVRDRFTYHFTDPSSFDTAVLVPHFFEQRYVADNVWVDAAVRYRAAHRPR